MLHASARPINMWLTAVFEIDAYDFTTSASALPWRRLIIIGGGLKPEKQANDFREVESSHFPFPDVPFWFENHGEKEVTFASLDAKIASTSCPHK